MQSVQFLEHLRCNEKSYKRYFVYLNMNQIRTKKIQKFFLY